MIKECQLLRTRIEGDLWKSVWGITLPIPDLFRKQPVVITYYRMINRVGFWEGIEDFI